MPLKESELLQFEDDKEQSELLHFESNNRNLHRLLAHGDEKILRCLTQKKEHGTPLTIVTRALRNSHNFCGMIKLSSALANGRHKHITERDGVIL